MDRMHTPSNYSLSLFTFMFSSCSLGGVGFTHLGAQGQDIIKAVITVASDNYPGVVSHRAVLI